MGEHPDVVHDRFVDRRTIDVLAQLDPASPLQVPVIHPDLEDLDPFGRLGSNRFSRVLGSGRLIEPIASSPPSWVVGKVRVRPAARSTETGLGNVARPADLAELLLELHRQRDRLSIRRG